MATATALVVAVRSLAAPRRGVLRRSTAQDTPDARPGGTLCIARRGRPPRHCARVVRLRNFRSPPAHIQQLNHQGSRLASHDSNQLRTRLPPSGQRAPLARSSLPGL